MPAELWMDGHQKGQDLCALPGERSGWLTSPCKPVQRPVSHLTSGFLGGSDSKEFACNVGDLGLTPGFGKIPWRRPWQPTPVFLPGESPWTEVPGGLQSTGSQKVGQDSEFHVISPQPAVCCVTTGRCCWLTRSSEKPGHHSSPSLLVVRKALRKPVALGNCLGFSSLAGKMCPNQPQRPGLGTPCQSLWSVEQRGKEQKPEGGPDDTPWLINWTK